MMDIEICTWCNGEGINLAYKGHTNPPNCTRCAGSGKILTTDEMSTTKRRRKYAGPAPKNDVTINPIEPIRFNSPDKLDAKLPILNQPKRRGRPPKHA